MPHATTGFTEQDHENERRRVRLEFIRVHATDLSLFEEMLERDAAKNPEDQMPLSRKEKILASMNALKDLLDEAKRCFYEDFKQLID